MVDKIKQGKEKMTQKVFKKKTIVIVGLGYVGLPLALLAQRKGYDVVGIVKNPKKAELINKKNCPFKDEKLSKQLRKFPILATTDFSVIKKSKIIVICVPTPIDVNHKPDFEPLISSCKNIGKFLQNGSLVILESTVNPGTTHDIVISLLEKQSNLIAGKDFSIAYCPERINPGDSSWNVENIPRVVGSLDNKGLDKTLKFYRSILSGNVKPMHSMEEAEAVKIVENCFRDINIAFVNELAMSFDLLGIDIMNVIEGASTKPFSFLPHFPGCGVGGHCISVDPYYMIEYASRNGFTHNFLSLARKINNSMPAYTVGLLLRGLEQKGKKVINSTVALLGIAYKKNIGDYRESPSFEILKLLKEKGMKVKVYDPHVMSKSNTTSLNDVLDRVDAVILATDHAEFLTLDPEKLQKKNIEIIIDGRNCLNKDEFIEAGIYYKGIGR